MKSYYEYRTVSRASINPRWNEAALVMLVIMLLSAVFQGPTSLQSILHMPNVLYYSWSGIYIAALFLIIAPIQMAFGVMILRMIRGGEERLLKGTWNFFREKFESLVPAAALMYVIVLGISLVTFFIGGIILSYAYAMLPYIIEDEPELGPKDLLRRSREMMRGHKWQLFVLDLSFIGWILLCIITLGIAVFWVTPWMETAHAHFYEDLKAEMAVSAE